VQPMGEGAFKRYGVSDRSRHSERYSKVSRGKTRRDWQG
jgi:hypothetical protein